MTTIAEATAAVAAADPALARTIAAVGPLPRRRRDPDGGFAALVRAITFQQLAGRAANAIHSRLRVLLGPDVGPEALLALSDEQLRTAGLSGAKIAALRDLSAKVLDGTVVLSRRTRLSDDEIVARLTTVHGVGRWTAEMYLIFELHRPDVWPVGDLGVRQGWARMHGLDTAPGARELAPLGDPFRPHRTLVALYCWRAVGPDLDLR